MWSSQGKDKKTVTHLSQKLTPALKVQITNSINGFELGTWSPSRWYQKLESTTLRSRLFRRRRRRHHGRRRRRCRRGEPPSPPTSTLTHAYAHPCFYVGHTDAMDTWETSYPTLLDRQSLFSPWYICLLYVLGIRPGNVDL